MAPCSYPGCVEPLPGITRTDVCLFHEHTEERTHARSVRAGMRSHVFLALYASLRSVLERVHLPLAQVPTSRGQADFLYRALSAYLETCSLDPDAQDVLYEELDALSERWNLVIRR